MVRGQADFGMYGVKTQGVGVADVGEAAARLGSIVTWDRCGDVIWLDDFESPSMVWRETSNGVTSAGELSPLSKRFGTQSYKMTAGDLINKYQLIERSLPILASERIGVECSISVPDDTLQFYVYVNLYYPTFYRIGGISTTIDTGLIEYFNSAGGLSPLATYGDMFKGTWVFHTVKVVFDFANERYARFIINNHEYDMSAIACDYFGGAGAPRLQLWIYAIQTANDTGSLYLHDVIVTSNEP